MFSLEEFAKSIQKSKVRVRRQDIDIRALAGFETARITDLYPRPVAPLGPNPDGGSNSLPVPNENDEGHRVREQKWFAQKKVMEVALAIDVVSVCGEDEAEKPDAVFKQEMDAAVKRVQKAFTSVEIQRVWESIRDLFDDSVMEKIKDALVVDAAKYWEDVALATGKAFELPKNYATTLYYQQLKMCERFGIDPRGMGHIEPGMMQVLLAHSRFRDEEDGRAMGIGE